MFHFEESQEKSQRLVAQMTLNEKISQLSTNAPAIERLGIPAYNWWNEGLHGVARAGTATSFPQAIAMAAMFDRERMQQIGDIIATEGRAKFNESSRHEDRDIYKGLTFFCPNINIFRDPRWGRGHETYGEDPYLTGELARYYVRGIQGKSPVMKASACLKHLAVHSGPENLRHSFDARVSQKDLYETYLAAFRHVIQTEFPAQVMGAYNRLNGEPCCGSYTLLHDILRKEWGFEGAVVSDCWALKDFHESHKVTKTPQESAALALKAGCDLNCGNTYIFLMQAYKLGLVTEEEITTAVTRLFTIRYQLGLNSPSEWDKIPYEKVECKEHIQASIEAARRCCVLLKNAQTLPLRKESLKTIGVIGPNANNRLSLKGNYYGTASRYITALEGIQDEAGEDCRVLFAKGCELIESRTEPLAMAHDRLAEALAVAEHSDVVILCLGLDETLEGEERDQGNHCGSGDKEDLQLPEVQRLLLEKVCMVGKPVILCLFAGSAIDLSYAQDHCAAILLAWYPGAYGGKALADILFGRVSPSGKLPITFYRSLEGLGDFTDYSMRNRTYRYYQGEPLYSFGYGLTYGQVVCRSLELLKEKDPQNGQIEVLVCLENLSDIALEDVIELYIRSNSPFAVPNVRLCGFQRVSLAAHEKVSLVLPVAADAFSAINEEGKEVWDGSRFTLYAGTFQPDARSVELTGQTPASLTIDCP